MREQGGCLSDMSDNAWYEWVVLGTPVPSKPFYAGGEGFQPGTTDLAQDAVHNRKVLPFHVKGADIGIGSDPVEEPDIHHDPLPNAPCGIAQKCRTQQLGPAPYLSNQNSVMDRLWVSVSTHSPSVRAKLLSISALQLTSYARLITIAMGIAYPGVCADWACTFINLDPDFKDASWL
jgi:hypothetical protein